jgi:uncharacterized membrane protein
VERNIPAIEPVFMGEPAVTVPGAGGRQMTMLIGKLHPLVLHFPIGLVLAAATAELLAILTGREPWRAIGIANLRAGAAMAALTAIAGWALTSVRFVEPSRLLEWHRWFGVAGAGAAIGAAALSWRLRAQSKPRLFFYQAALLGAAALIAIAGHLGGTLVWGADFLHP